MHTAQCIWGEKASPCPAGQTNLFKQVNIETENMLL